MALSLVKAAYGCTERWVHHGSSEAEKEPTLDTETTKIVAIRPRKGGHAMGQDYSVRLHGHEQWIVSVRGDDFLACSRLNVALKTIEEATNLLNGCKSTPASSNIFSHPKVREQPLSEHYLAALQLVAFEHGWHIEQQGEKYYLRSLEPETLRSCEDSAVPTPTNHLAFFKSL